MTINAIRVSRHMVIVFSNGCISIVTGRTVTLNILVIEMGLGKGRGNMAHRAVLVIDRNVRRIDLGTRAGCSDTIMTRGAVIDDTGMVKHGWCKGTPGHVADTAILGCHHVRRVDLGVFTGCGNTMAGIAAHGQHGGVAVVHKRVGKIGRIMAQGTVGRCFWVRRSRRLPSGSKCNKTGAAVMARDTITGNALVR